MRPINPDNVAPWFDYCKLKAYFLMNGYEAYSAPLAKALCVNESTAKDKMRLSRFSHEETIKIATFLGLTKEQYCEVFLKDVGLKNTPD